VRAKQETILLQRADRAALARLGRTMRVSWGLHIAAVLFTALRFASRSLEGWIEGRRVLNPDFVLLGLTDMLVSSALSFVLHEGARKVGMAAEGGLHSNAVEIFVELGTHLGGTFEALKVAWTVQAVVYFMYLALYGGAGMFEGVAALSAIVLLELNVRVAWRGYPYRHREARARTANPLVVASNVVAPEAPSLRKVVEAADSAAPDAARTGDPRHFFLLPGQVATFAEVVGEMLLAAGAEGLLYFATLVEAVGSFVGGNYVFGLVAVNNAWGYHVFRRTLLRTSAAFEELMDSEGTLDEVVEAFGGNAGDETPFLGSESNSMCYLFRTLGETAFSIGLVNAAYGVWGTLQVLDFDKPLVALADRAAAAATDAVYGALGW